MTEHKLELAITLALLSVVLTGSQEVAIWVFSGIGGIIGGMAGSIMFPRRGFDMRTRWVVNFSIAIIAAPFLTWYLFPKFPTIPLPFLAMAVSGTLGACGVLILPFILRKHGIDPTGKNGRNGKED